MLPTIISGESNFTISSKEIQPTGEVVSDVSKGYVTSAISLTQLEWNKEYNTNYNELDFNVSTPVYNETILKDFLAPIRQWCYRSHFLKLPPGGYFPPHRDKSWESIRLILPLFNCNAPLTRFILEDKTLQWELGRMYFVNTLKEHTLFNASADQDSIWLVLNYIVNEESINWIYKNLAIT